MKTGKKVGVLGTPEIEYEHPAAVMVGFSRGYGTGQKLFGSSIKHRTSITLRIVEGYQKRMLNGDWFGGQGKTLLEVELSPMQFSELLTTMNSGSGVTGTLRYYNGKTYEFPGFPTAAEHFKKEVGESFKVAIGSVRKAVEAVQSLAAGPRVTKSMIRDAVREVEAIEKNITEHLPFVLDQFREEMERSVAEAKAAIDDAAARVSLPASEVPALPEMEIER